MSRRALLGFVFVAACNGGGAKPDAMPDGFVFPDAPNNPPTLTSFSPTPTTVQPGVPTVITWTWTYQTEPVSPAPTCEINNGVGAVTNGQMTMVTLTESTLYRLSCYNSVGMTARDALVSLPAAPPTIAAFTVSPTAVMPNTPTTLTFNWMFSGFPSPTPTCTIDGGVAPITTPLTTSTSATLPQARTYRLRCTSSAGTSFRDVSVAVNECAGGTHECNANATCQETAESYTCACNATYTANGGSGDVCSRSGVTAGQCHANATYNAGSTSCVCNAGYVGDGLTCTRLPITFVTPTFGIGALNASNWPTQNVTATGLAAADQICTYWATQNSLPGTYVAWMSDTNNDAYCRVHGGTGKKGNCVGATVPVSNAGPWVRSDTARTPAFPKIDRLLAPTRQTLALANYTSGISELTEASTAPVAWTGTSDTGEYIAGSTCNDWTDGTTASRGAQGHVMGGGTSWTDYLGATDPYCNVSARLRCVEVLDGPALPSRRPANAKRAFVTSVTGTGLLSSWADAQVQSGASAADQVCQSRARYAGYANALTFKAWLGYYPYYAYTSPRIVNSGPWYRPDGVLIASSQSDLIDTRLASPLYQTEAGAYLAGNSETGTVWTGARSDGYYYSTQTFSYACSSWASTSGSAIVGRHDLADWRWSGLGSSSSTPTSTQACNATDFRLYCFEDRP